MICRVRLRAAQSCQSMLLICHVSRHNYLQAISTQYAVVAPSHLKASHRAVEATA